MRQILKDLYFGNINPNERGYYRGSAYGKAIRELTECEEALRGQLGDPQKELLDGLISAQSEVNDIAYVEDFVAGFRLGARLMMAVLADDEENFYPLGKP